MWGEIKSGSTDGDFHLFYKTRVLLKDVEEENCEGKSVLF